MKRLVIIEVDDETAANVLEAARESGQAPDAIAGALFHLGAHMAEVAAILNTCPALRVLFPSAP